MSQKGDIYLEKVRHVHECHVDPEQLDDRLAYEKRKRSDNRLREYTFPARYESNKTDV